MSDDLTKISQLLDEKLEPVRKELKNHGELLKNHGKILRSLKKGQATILEVLDEEQMKQRKRLNRVEEHLGFSSPTS